MPTHYSDVIDHKKIVTPAGTTKNVENHVLRNKNKI